MTPTSLDAMRSLLAAMRESSSRSSFEASFDAMVELSTADDELIQPEERDLLEQASALSASRYERPRDEWRTLPALPAPGSAPAQPQTPAQPPPQGPAHPPAQGPAVPRYPSGTRCMVGCGDRDDRLVMSLGAGAHLVGDDVGSLRRPFYTLPGATLPIGELTVRYRSLDRPGGPVQLGWYTGGRLSAGYAEPVPGLEQWHASGHADIGGSLRLPLDPAAVAGVDLDLGVTIGVTHTEVGSWQRYWDGRLGPEVREGRGGVVGGFVLRLGVSNDVVGAYVQGEVAGGIIPTSGITPYGMSSALIGEVRATAGLTIPIRLGEAPTPARPSRDDADADDR